MTTTDNFNLKVWLNSSEYEHQKEINRKEVNRYKLVIDYATFKHTPEEKARLYYEKKDWKKMQMFK